MLRKLLYVSRYLMVLPVIGSLFLTLSVVVSGLVLVLVQEWELLQVGEYSARTAKQLTLTVIEAIDMFLVGAISYIIAVGVYILFIGQKDDQLFKRFKIESLADLENKVIGIVVVAMAVGFVGKASEAPGPLAVLQLGGGIALVIAALCLFLRFSGPPEKS
ncbi:MAG TPA: YqhA family protein [Anaerolineales bacterium]|nr:YqhA family protein [Anaerolineales bacterium]